MTTEQLEKGKKINEEINIAKQALEKLQGNGNILLGGIYLEGDPKKEARCVLILHFKEKIERLEKEFEEI